MPDSFATCRWCGVDIASVSLAGRRGVEWVRIPATGMAINRCSPREADSPVHRPDLPDFDDQVETESWLDGVKEGLDA